MEQITKVIPQIKRSVLTYDEYLKQKVDSYNSLSGNLTGYDCKKCLNRGYFMKIINGDESMVACDCMKKREALIRLKNSGLAGSIKEKTFSSFEANQSFQQHIKSEAVKFVKSYKGKWFFIGGQNGCGKTHICTAIAGQLLKFGESVRYLLWEDDSPVLKAKVNDPEYKTLILGYQTVDVLYIDDLFKTNATEADIRLAFQILDYRDRNSLCTIISSERMIDEIYKINPAIGGRIAEMAMKINIPKDINKDYRLKRKE